MKQGVRSDSMSMRRRGGAPALLVALGLAVAGNAWIARAAQEADALEPPRDAAAAGLSDPVRVYFPGGACETGVLEVELFDREGGVWRPHPRHARVLADRCQVEDAGQLLQELRVRCVDPGVAAAPSEWTEGVNVFRPGSDRTCDDSRSVTHPMAPLFIHMFDPLPGEAVAPLGSKTPVRGRVLASERLEVLVHASLLRRAGFESFADVVQEIAALRQLPLNWRTFGDASGGLPAALATLARSPKRALERRGATQVLVLVDGARGRPFGTRASYEPAYRERLLEAIEILRATSVGLHLAVVENIRAPENPPRRGELERRVRSALEAGPPSAGSLFRRRGFASLPETAVSLLDPELTDLVVLNRTVGAGATDIQFDDDGLFEGELPLTSGSNLVEIRAQGSDGRSQSLMFEFEFDASAYRDHLHERERARMERARNRKGRVEVEVEGLP